MTDTKALVRRNDPSTSWDAAMLQTPERRRALYSRIRAALEDRPMTDEELEAYLRAAYPSDGFTPSGVRSRRHELVETGWVTEEREDDGGLVKRPGATGSPRIVWRAVLHGEEAPTGPARPSKRERQHDEGLRAARRYAAWEIGDTSWGDLVVDAYLNPARVNAELDEEMGDD